MTVDKGTVLLGLDGVNWFVLLKFVRANIMPNLSKLLRTSAYGNLRSTIPPVTGAAWLSMATGLNPGKTGVIDFLVKEKNNKCYNNTLRLVSSKHYRGKAYWDLLSVMGKKVSVFFYPLTYPPYPVNGCLVSGLGVPFNKPISYPPEIARRIRNFAPNFSLYIDYHDPIYDNVEIFIEDVGKHLKDIYYIVKNIILRECSQGDNITIVISATDWILHRLWHLIDNKHYYFDEKIARRYKDAINELWYSIDNIIGLISEYAYSTSKYMLMVSDHGFGSNNCVFNLTKWLIDRGYMRVKKRKLVSYILMKQFTKAIYEMCGKISLFRKIFRKIIEKANVVPPSITDIIDFDRSYAVTLGHTIVFGGIYIQEKNNMTRSALITKLVRELKSLAQTLGIEVDIYIREDIYHGNMIKNLPDLIIAVENYACSVTEDPISPLFTKSSWSSRHTGSHRMDGIFLFSGEDVKSIKNITVSIYDIMPTLLFLHKLPIPHDVDGKPISNIIKEYIKPKVVPRTFYDIRFKLSRINMIK